MNDLQNLHEKSELDISLDTLTGLIQQAEAMWQPMLLITKPRNPLVRLKHAFLAKIGLVTSDRYQQQAEFNASVIKICYWLSTAMHHLQHYLQVEREQKRQQQQSLVDTQQSLVDTQQSLVDTQQSLADTQQSLVDIRQLLSTLQAQLQESSAIHFRTRSMLQTITESQQEIPATIKDLLAAQQHIQEELQQLQARVEQIQGRVMDHALAQTLLAEQIHTLQQVNPASLSEL